jgi:hypothetical protein
MLPLHPPKWAIPFRESVPLAGSPPRIGPADALDGVVRSGAAVERRTKARPAAPHRDTPGAGPQHPCPPAPLPPSPLAPEPPCPRAPPPTQGVQSERAGPRGSASMPSAGAQLRPPQPAGSAPAARSDSSCGAMPCGHASGPRVRPRGRGDFQRHPAAPRGTQRHSEAPVGQRRGSAAHTGGASVQSDRRPTPLKGSGREGWGREYGDREQRGPGATGTGSNGGCRASRRARLLGGLVGHRSSGRGLEVLAIALGGPIPLRGLE